MLEICFKIQTEECKSKHSGICDIFILFIFYSLSYFHSQTVKAFPFLFEKKKWSNIYKYKVFFKLTNIY